ncbi:MAG: magnesium transporter [Puniceicoccaceae bacterium]|nr:MAG: magnesium transporter [Puniceicoccaceae bacterium]
MNLENDLNTIQDLLLHKDWAKLRTFLGPVAPEELTTVFDRFSPSDQVLIFRCLSREQAGDAFSFFDDAQQEHFLEALTDQETRDVLAHMSPDDRTFLFEELPATVTQKLLNFLNPEDRKESLQLLGYPEDSVGRLMSPEFASVLKGMNVAEAMAVIKKQAADSETLNMVYVTDEKGKLLDAIRLRRFIAAEDGTPLSALMDGRFTALKTSDPEEHAVKVMQQTGYFALPVTDSAGVLIGIVTADDVLDVAVEAATEDIHKGGAITPLDTNYLQAPLRLLYSRRISWLVILVFMNIFSGAGIAHFEELIESVVALVFFLPLLIDSGGNAGSQAATLVIRSMALGEVRMLDYLKVAWRELRVSLLLGLSMSAAVFLLAWWRSGIEVGVVVSLSMVCIVILGSLVGMSLPFILKKLNQDPAAASAPLVTSIADISGVLIYLGIASMFLGHIIES